MASPAAAAWTRGTLLSPADGNATELEAGVDAASRAAAAVADRVAGRVAGFAARVFFGFAIRGHGCARQEAGGFTSCPQLLSYAGLFDTNGRLQTSSQATWSRLCA